MTYKLIKHGLLIGKPSKEVLQAYFSYRAQVNRCTNPKNKHYHCYGGKGLGVSYSLDEFVSWWTKSLARRSEWKRPTCGRIDHAKGYSFDNIEMQEASENAKEMYHRVGHPTPFMKKVMMLDSKGNDAILFESVHSAQKHLGIFNVGRICKGQRKQEQGFSFRYFTEEALSLS